MENEKTQKNKNLKENLKKAEVVNKIIENKGNLSKACDQSATSRSTLYKWLEDDNFREQLKIKSEQVIEKSFVDLKMLAEKSLMNYTELLNTTDVKLKRQVSKDIIDWVTKIKNSTSNNSDTDTKKVKEIVIEVNKTTKLPIPIIIK